MGGSGSGASRTRRIAEESKRIDIREWRRLGYLAAPHRFRWAWTLGGEPSGSITVATEPREATLSYSIETTDGWSPIKEHVTLDWRPCRFGGHRKYFRCPRCWRGAEVLYYAKGRFVCRVCGRVGYAIENLEKQWRADRLYRRLETRLNEDGSKPARMRWETYNRICERMEGYDAASMAGLEKVIKRLLSR